jgi:hypothetical protein
MAAIIQHQGSLDLMKNELLNSKAHKVANAAAALAIATGSSDEAMLFYLLDVKKLAFFNGTSLELVGAPDGTIFTLRATINNADTNPNFPVGAIAGDVHRIQTVDGQVGTIKVQVGDQIYFDGTDWNLFEGKIQNASETEAGLAQKATLAEVLTGTDPDKFVTPLTLASKIQDAAGKRKAQIPGDGTTTVFPISHTLASQDVVASFQRDIDKTPFVAAYTPTNATTVTVEFSPAPANGEVINVYLKRMS